MKSWSGLWVLEDFFKLSSANTQFTPAKSNMEPNNEGLEKEHSFKTWPFLVSMFVFPGVKMRFYFGFHVRFQAVYGFVSSTLLRCWLPLNQSYAWAWSHRQLVWVARESIGNHP